jgi:hypothetical protein
MCRRSDCCVSIAFPFAGVDRRTAWLRAVLLAATFLGLLASAPVWANARAYPLLPIASWFPILPAPWDKGLFGAMLLALVLGCWFYRWAVIMFLSASLFAFCEDQNRGQPWLYMYWVMLLLTLFPSPAPIAACRLAMSAVYFWSGLQKCHPRFFQVVPEWFVAPATNWHLPSFAIAGLHWSVAAAPFVEIAIGVALWVPRLRRPAILTVAALHLGALLFLSPLGHNYNWVVWPWNLAMIALICALFTTGKFWQKSATDPVCASAPNPPQPDGRASVSRKSGAVASSDIGFAQTFAELRRSKPALVLLALYSLLPILSFIGKWDSDFSFSLYSENQAAANVFVTKAFGERLPPRLRRYFQPFRPDYDPQHQGPYAFAFQAWCYEELHVPPIPEPRNFRCIFRFLRAYAREPEDLRMIVGTRGGPVLFWQGDRVEFLQPAR